jgi:hypothetical protein
MTEVALNQADDAFSKQVSAQVGRIAGELNRLEQLLSAGMVDRRVVAEFRGAVDRLSKTSGYVKCWMDGNLQSLSSMLIEERIEAASQLANLLAVDLQQNQETFPGITQLKHSIQKLGRAIGEERVELQESPEVPELP